VLPLTNADGNAADAGATVLRAAIGARVEVNLDNDPQFPQGSTLVRLIDGGSSFLGQNEPVAQFGLGETTDVAVRVLFPNGDVEVLTDVASNQQIYLGDLPPSLGDLTGSVVTGNGDPIPSVAINLGLYSAVTGLDGTFNIPGMSADATYALTASLTGYWPATVWDISIAEGETTTLAPIVLDPLGPPIISISAPITNVTNKAVSYTIAYRHADEITLSPADLTLNQTGTADGSLSVTGSGANTRTVTVSDIAGSGTLGISIAAGTASNIYGPAPEAGPSATFVASTYRPVKPTSLRAAPVAFGEIQLTWTDNSNNEGGFAIERKATGGVWSQIATGAANTNLYLDADVLPGITYCYRIRAYNYLGYSPYSNTIKVKSYALEAPTGLGADAVSSSQINLTWTDNSDNESGFKIERRKGTSTSWSVIKTVGANVTAFANTGLSSATQYHYRVRAYNASGFSAYTDVADATTL
jgi:hypothetical protein